MNGSILNIEHFAVHDGPGIRMVVFLKGCPLHCIWCHTPESQSGKIELVYQEEYCIHCGSCMGLAGRLPRSDVSEADRRLVEKCPARALRTAGEIVSAQDVIDEAVKEKKFFDESNGGLTVSGGEVLFQPEFTLELLKSAKDNNISCCLETCGFGKYDDLMNFLPFTQIFLYDFKASNPEIHHRLTGVDNILIKENLENLSNDGARIHLRCPLIPEVNDSIEHLIDIADTAEKLPGIEEVHIIPYHPMALGKYKMLKRKCPDLPSVFPPQSTIDFYVETIAKHTGKPVLIP